MDQAAAGQWHFESRSDAGKVRELNEDNLLCAPNEGLWIVADGMGGHLCGEVASALAIESIQSHMAQGQSLTEAVQSAHHDIIKAVDNGSGAEGMGTTVVAVESTDDIFSIAWVGDSRAYLWNYATDSLTQLTHDHSLVERLLSSGLISADEARTHPQRHLITQCLGSRDLEDVKVEQVQHKWAPEQVLIMCSDGLTEELSDEDIRTIMSAENELDVSADRLLRMALNKGGQDNISLVLIESPKARPFGIKGLSYTVATKVRKWLGKN